MESVNHLTLSCMKRASMTGDHSDAGFGIGERLFHEPTIDLNVVLCHACGRTNVVEAPAPCAMIGAAPIRKISHEP